MKQNMKSDSSDPVIFRNFGRLPSTTTWRLPDFLYTYVVAGCGTVRTDSESLHFFAGNSFVVARHHSATLTLEPDTDVNDHYHTIHIRLSESEVEDYFLHNPASVSQSAAPSDLLQLLPDHPLFHGLSLLLEDGICQGFRPEWIFAKMKIQECLHILIALNERLYPWFSFHNHPQKIDLRAFMEKNYRHNIPLSQLAGAAGRSLSAFRRDFLKEFGTTPSRWLIIRRLDEARLLIASGRRPGEILIELGFESFSHFTRCYKQRFGVLPSASLSASPHVR